MIVRFDQEADRRKIGGKGYHLCRMAQAGLPVPVGFCVTAEELSTIPAPEIAAALEGLGAAAVAVRSSAIEEDSPKASFAGIYRTRLNLITAESVIQALGEIQQSTSAPAALAYRERQRIPERAESPTMAAVVQSFVAADASGVLFTRDPVHQSDLVIVEASWGLGEAVAGGLLTPDRWEISKDGKIISCRLAHKDIAIVPDATGTKEIEVEPARRNLSSLDADALRELAGLARACDQLFGAPQEIEWALDAARLWLLQSRPITGRRAPV